MLATAIWSYVTEVNDVETYSHDRVEFGRTFGAERLQEKVNVLAKKMGMGNVPKVFWETNSSTWSAVGGYHYPQFRGGICIPKYVLFDPNHFEYILKDSHSFVLLHELSHHLHRHAFAGIRALKRFSMCFVPLSLCAAFYTPCRIFSPPLQFLAMEITAMVAMNIFARKSSRFYEKQADLDGCLHTSDKEKLSAVARFKFILEENLQERNKKGVPFLESLWRKAIIDPQGNFRLDWQHPPLTERIQYIQATLDKKIDHFDHHAFLGKYQRISLRNDTRKPFGLWLTRQVLYDEEGEFRSNLQIMIQTIKHLLFIPYYLFKFNSDRLSYWQSLEYYSARYS